MDAEVRSCDPLSDISRSKFTTNEIETVPDLICYSRLTRVMTTDRRALGHIFSNSTKYGKSAVALKEFGRVLGKGHYFPLSFVTVLF